ncbi:hypothetical protein EPN44_09990 [bacterium]|nr:MAG: hypothetical protein EPN44_09990 [bacterium]
MTGRLRLAWVACVAVAVTLLGHAAAYLVQGRDLADGRHAYFAPSLDVASALAILGATLLVVRAAAGRAVHPPSLPALPHLWAGLSIVQVGGFALLERLEGQTPDLIGCVVEALTALLVAVALTLFFGLVGRCAAGAPAAYLRRYGDGPSLKWCTRTGVRVPLQPFAARMGTRRFKRPPPAI